MNHTKLRRWLLIGLFVASVSLPLARIAADVSAALKEAPQSAQLYDLHNQVADPTPGGSGGGGG